MRIEHTLFAALLFLPHTAFATPCVVPDSQEVGHGRMRVMLVDIYDANLSAPDGIWHEDKPFSLRLDYLHNLEGSKIAASSIDEMRHTGISDASKLSLWKAEMEKIFPDVHAGSSLTGVYDPKGATVFCQDGHIIGRVDDPAFGPAFFNIWLSPKTSMPALRQQLLGNKT
jgi:Chalcone isomerase-like